MPIAEFADPARADAAWALLEDADIPASVVTDSAVLGAREVTRLYVEATNVAQAQALVRELIE